MYNLKEKFINSVEDINLEYLEMWGVLPCKEKESDFVSFHIMQGKPNEHFITFRKKTWEKVYRPCIGKTFTLGNKDFIIRVEKDIEQFFCCFIDTLDVCGYGEQLDSYRTDTIVMKNCTLAISNYLRGHKLMHFQNLLRMSKMKKTLHALPRKVGLKFDKQGYFLLSSVCKHSGNFYDLPVCSIMKQIAKWKKPIKSQAQGKYQNMLMKPFKWLFSRFSELGVNLKDMWSKVKFTKRVMGVAETIGDAYDVIKAAISTLLRTMIKFVDGLVDGVMDKLGTYGPMVKTALHCLIIVVCIGYILKFDGKCFGWNSTSTTVLLLASKVLAGGVVCASVAGIMDQWILEQIDEDHRDVFEMTKDDVNTHHKIAVEMSKIRMDTFEKKGHKIEEMEMHDVLGDVGDVKFTNGDHVKWDTLHVPPNSPKDESKAQLGPTLYAGLIGAVSACCFGGKYHSNIRDVNGAFTLSKNVSQLIDWGIQNLKTILNKAFEHFVGRPIFEEFSLVREYEEKINYYHSLRLKHDGAQMFHEQPSLAKEVAEFYQKCLTRNKLIVNCQSLSQMERSNWVRMLTSMNEIYQCALDYMKVQKSRIVPVWIDLMGTPGIGKSYAMEYLLDYVKSLNIKSGLQTVEYSAADRFERKPGIEFWDGYSGQWAVTYDDIYQTKDVQQRTITSNELISAINSYTFPLNMAALTDKGSTTFESKIVLSSRNSYGIPADQGLKCPDALDRRCHLPIIVTLKEKYYKKVGDKKMPNLPSKMNVTASMDIWDFHIFDYMSQTGKEMTPDFTAPHDVIGFKELGFLINKKMLEANSDSIIREQNLKQVNWDELWLEQGLLDEDVIEAQVGKVTRRGKEMIISCDVNEDIREMLCCCDYTPGFIWYKDDPQHVVGEGKCLMPGPGASVDFPPSDYYDKNFDYKLDNKLPWYKRAWPEFLWGKQRLGNWLMCYDDFTVIGRCDLEVYYTKQSWFDYAKLKGINIKTATRWYYLTFGAKKCAMTKFSSKQIVQPNEYDCDYFYRHFHSDLVVPDGNVYSYVCLLTQLEIPLDLDVLHMYEVLVMEDTLSKPRYGSHPRHMFQEKSLSSKVFRLQRSLGSYVKTNGFVASLALATGIAILTASWMTFSAFMFPQIRAQSIDKKGQYQDMRVYQSGQYAKSGPRPRVVMKSVSQGFSYDNWFKELTQEDKERLHYMETTELSAQGGLGNSDIAFARKIMINNTLMEMTFRDGSTHQQNIQFLFGAVGVTIKHGLEVGDLVHISLLHKKNTGGSLNFGPGEFNVTKLPTRDIAFIEFGRNCPNFKDIRHFMRLNLLDHFHGVRPTRLEWMDDGYDKLNFMNGVAATLVSRELDNVFVYNQKKIIVPTTSSYYMLKCGGFNGACAFPYVSLDPCVREKFLGLHIGQISDNGICAPVCRSDIPPLIFPNSSVSLTDHIVVEAQGFFDPEKDMPLVEGTLPFCALSKKPFMPMETNIRPSPFQIGVVDLNSGHVYHCPYPIEKMPAKLRKGEVDGVIVSPYQLTLKKFGMVYCPAIPEYFNKILDDPRMFNGILTDEELSVPRRLFTLQEAVLGVPDKGNVHSIDRTTSIGWPGTILGVTTQQWIKVHHDVVEFDSVFMSIYDQETAVLELGQVPMYVVNDTLKDEVRELDRVKAYKTRLFDAGPKSWLLRCRVYFGDIVSGIEKSRILKDVQIGMNVHSIEWQMLKNRLVGAGFTKFLAGDIEHFDKNMALMFADIICKFFQSLYGFEVTEQCKRQMYLLLRALLQAFHNSPFGMYRAKNGNSSGNFLTSVLNSIVNSIYFRSLWCVLVPEALMWQFDTYVRMAVYGDDSVLGISDVVIKYFNMLSLKHAFKQFYGITYTSPDKKELTQSYLPLEQVVFLQRRFLDRDGCCYPALNPTSIKSMVLWVNKQSNANEEMENFIQTTKAAAMEWFYHGPDLYDHHLRILNTRLRCLSQKYVIHESYKDRQRRWLLGHSQQ